MVTEAWNEGLGEGIQFRLENCANRLRDWAEASFGAIRSQIKEGERKLKAAQRCAPDASMMANCKALSDHLDNLHSLEESYWHLRPRANELRDGDKNTRYFHHKASSRRKRNLIKGLNDDDGNWKTSNADLERLITAFYESLFSTSSPSGFMEALEGLGATVTHDMNEALKRNPLISKFKHLFSKCTRLRHQVRMVFMHFFIRSFGM